MKRLKIYLVALVNFTSTSNKKKFIKTSLKSHFQLSRSSSRPKILKISFHISFFIFFRDNFLSFQFPIFISSKLIFIANASLGNLCDAPEFVFEFVPRMWFSFSRLTSRNLWDFFSDEIYSLFCVVRREKLELKVYFEITKSHREEARAKMKIESDQEKIFCWENWKNLNWERVEFLLKTS
jgi:hypothetical protein